MDWLRDALTDESFLMGWMLLVIVALVVLVHDLRSRNREIGGLMKWVWSFTVAYSGPLGLAVYYYSGRKQIARDSLWRRPCGIALAASRPAFRGSRNATLMAWGRRPDKEPIGAWSSDFPMLSCPLSASRELPWIGLTMS